MSNEFFRIEVSTMAAVGMTFKERAAASGLRKQQMSELYSWARSAKQPLKDFTTQAKAEAAMQKVQVALPALPLRVQDYSYLL